MFTLFDSHNHFFNSQDMESDLATCISKNIKSMAICSISESDWSEVSLLAEKYENVYPQFGVHPWHSKYVIDGWQERLVQYLQRFPAAGVGECGLDKSGKYKSTIEQQMLVFKKQLQIGNMLNRPLSIHCVRAWMELFDCLGNYRGKVKGVIHSFSGSVEVMEQLVKAGFYISFSPFILKNISDKIIESIKTTPIDRLLIETDSPDTRVIHKDFSTPAGLNIVLEKVAEIRSEDIDVVAASTYGNAKRLFRA